MGRWRSGRLRTRTSVPDSVGGGSGADVTGGVETSIECGSHEPARGMFDTDGWFSVVARWVWDPAYGVGAKPGRSVRGIDRVGNRGGTVACLRWVAVAR